jgi:hypothetical protein
MNVLIVANETAAGEHLQREVSRLIQLGAKRFTLLVPATKPRGTMTWTEGSAKALAEERLKRAVDSLRRSGADVTGVVGIERPMDAVMDAIRANAFDEIIVSTLPQGVSHWLRVDLPARIGRASGLPVHHIIGVGERQSVSA